MKTTYPLLVLSLPRSGTLFTAKFLRHAGWSIGHETYGSEGICSWMAAADCTWVPFGKGITRLPPTSMDPGGVPVTFDHKIALIRDPLSCLASIREVCFSDQSKGKFLKFVAEHLCYVKGPDNAFAVKSEFSELLRPVAGLQQGSPTRLEQDLLLSCAFYVGWFHLIETHQPARWFRIEDQHLDLIGYLRPYLPSPNEPLEPEPPSNRTHHRQSKSVSWSDIANFAPHYLQPLRKIAERFGYLGYL